MTRAEVRMFVAAVCRVEADALHFDATVAAEDEIARLDALANELDDEADAMGLTVEDRHEAWERFFRPGTL